MRARLVLIALAMLLPLRAVAQGKPEQVVAALSQARISITANFEGAEILVFGAVKRDSPAPTDPPLQVIVTIAGPSAPVTVRRKSRRFGIWMNTASVKIDAAPSFYAVATTAPLSQVLSHTEDLRHKISIPLMIRSVGASTGVSHAEDFTKALIGIRKNDDHFALNEGGVTLTDATLFRTSIVLPANLTEGTYTTRIFLTRGGKVIDDYSTSINVNMVGLERWTFKLANQQPAIYGILSVVIAVVAGWGASAAFRMLRR